jgi:hypothetical protein
VEFLGDGVTAKTAVYFLDRMVFQDLPQNGVSLVLVQSSCNSGSCSWPNSPWTSGVPWEVGPVKGDWD